MSVESDLVARLLAGDASLFEGTTATHALGWLRHPERYLGAWLDDVAPRLPRRHGRTLLLGMGGSSSPARLYADWRADTSLTVLDTSNPDTIFSTDFSHANVIASSKSGGTIETQTLLAHALANGLSPEDLVIVTDPGTSLVELGRSLGALVIEGDPDTGGRFSSLSPFGLVPALYAGWSVDELRKELADCVLTESLVEGAVTQANRIAGFADGGEGHFELGGDPIISGGALWLEQLIAETTGKHDRGFVPVIGAEPVTYRPSMMQHYHLIAALLARRLGVDPFNQPNVESAKKEVFALLEAPVSWVPIEHDTDQMLELLRASSYNVLQVYAPLDTLEELSGLRNRMNDQYGTTTANLGPRYLHSTGQLHKGGPRGVVGVQIIQRPTSAPVRISGRRYTFHDLHMAQAQSDYRAMKAARRPVFQLMVDDLDEAGKLLHLQP
jgi:hypothetical protein